MKGTIQLSRAILALTVIGQVAATVNFNAVQNNFHPLFKSNIYGVTWLSIDYNSSVLYFEWLAIDKNTTIINLSKVDFEKNTSLLLFTFNEHDVYSFTVNDKDKEIYSGRRGGIYKYDMKTNVTTLHVKFDDVGYPSYINNDLYFYSDKNWYIVDPNGGYTLYPNLNGTDAYRFLIYDSVLFFVNKTGLYRRITSADAELIKAGIESRNMAIDSKGHVYVMAKDGVYYLDKNNTLNIKKLFSLEEGVSITFDKNDDMIFSEWYKGVFRLIQNCGTNLSSSILLYIIVSKCVLSYIVS